MKEDDQLLLDEDLARDEVDMKEFVDLGASQHESLPPKKPNAPVKGNLAEMNMSKPNSEDGDDGMEFSERTEPSNFQLQNHNRQRNMT